MLERDSRLYVSTRTSPAAPWGAPAVAPELDLGVDAATAHVGTPHLLADGSALYLASDARGTWDIYRTTRTGSGWSTPTTVDEVNTAALEWTPTLSADGLTLYFGSDRSASAGSGGSIWVAHRATSTGTFGAAVKVTELDFGRDEFPSWVSPDGCRLYFSQNIDVGGGVYTYRSFVAEQP